MAGSDAGGSSSSRSRRRRRRGSPARREAPRKPSRQEDYELLPEAVRAALSSAGTGRKSLAASCPEEAGRRPIADGLAGAPPGAAAASAAFPGPASALAAATSAAFQGGALAAATSAALSPAWASAACCDQHPPPPPPPLGVTAPAALCAPPPPPPPPSDGLPACCPMLQQAALAATFPQEACALQAMQEAAMLQMAMAQQAAFATAGGAVDLQALMAHGLVPQQQQQQLLMQQALLAQSFATAAQGADPHQAAMAQALQAMQETVADDPSQLDPLVLAAREAQQAQYLQQAQFYQQLREEDAAKMKARVAKSADAWGEGEEDSRFKGNFRPLRLCKHFTTAGCWRGADCTYAHTLEELHPASPDMPRQDLAVAAPAAEPGRIDASQIPDVRMKKKREMCHKFQNNECVLGRACPFAHHENELGTVELVITDKVKTRICKFWECGKCIFATNCVNAHGEKEIGTKRPAFMTPPMKKRRADESVEDFRASVLAKPRDSGAAASS